MHKKLVFPYLLPNRTNLGKVECVDSVVFLSAIARFWPLKRRIDRSGTDPEESEKTMAEPVPRQSLADNVCNYLKAQLANRERQVGDRLNARHIATELKVSRTTINKAIEKLVDTYLGLRDGKEETFLEAYRRVGEAPFKEALYGAA